MGAQQARQEAIRRVIHKHLRVGEWLICIDRERGYFDAVFIGWGDDRLIAYPTSYVKKVIGKRLPKASLDAIDDELMYEVVGENGAVIGSFNSPYRTWVSPKDAQLIRKQMNRISSTKECHEFINDLLCLKFGVCQGW